MTTRQHYTFTPASNPVLRWLTDPGANVPAHIRPVLLGELFNSPTAILMGVINGLMVSGLALVLHGGGIFVVFALLDCALSGFRYHVARRTAEVSARGLPAPTDMYIFTGILWCALQGALIFTGTHTDIFAIQIFCAATAAGLIGPICARNYPAPRLAILLAALCVLPLDAALLMRGEMWTLLLVVQAPIYHYGCYLIITRYQSISIDLLLAHHDSHHRAAHDPLTDLLNRTGLKETLATALPATRNGLVLFFLDLDGFKPINDTFGHEAGDLVLKGVAGVLKGATRSGDIVARLGGDEFVVAAPDMPVSAAQDLSRLLIERISEEEFKIDATSRARVGVSIGYACFPEDGATIEDLLRNADAALYEVKRGGRGMHRRYRSPLDPAIDAAASGLTTRRRKIA